MKRPATVLLTVALLAFTGRLTAAATVERGSAFSTQIALKQNALCDGSVKLSPGTYKLDVVSMGDGSVRATINGNGKTCQATGKLEGGIQPDAGHGAIQPDAGRGGIQPDAGRGGIQPDAGRGGIQPDAGRVASHALTFESFGFTSQSQHSFQTLGNHLNVIVKGPGSNQITIGLLLPAVK